MDSSGDWDSEDAKEKGWTGSWGKEDENDGSWDKGGWGKDTDFGKVGWSKEGVEASIKVWPQTSEGPVAEASEANKENVPPTPVPILKTGASLLE